MSIPFLLTVIIILLGISLAIVLYPKQSERHLNKVSRTKKPAPKPRAGESPTQEKLDQARQELSEAEAMRKAVREFASKDPEATAKILKGWIKKK